MAKDVMDGYTNRWPEKLVNFHMKASGLNNNNPLFRKYLYVNMAFRFIVIWQQLCGIITRLVEGNVTLVQIITPLIFTIFLVVGMMEACILVFRRNLAVRCVKKSTEELHCLSYVDENIHRRNHLPVLKLFLVVHVGFMHFLGLFRSVISPVMRFGFKLGKSSVIVAPIEYPVDVFSSSELFWTACVYEAVLYWFAVIGISNINAVFLHVFTTARIRCDALNQFFREMTVGSGRQESLRKRVKDDAFTEESDSNRWAFMLEDMRVKSTSETNSDNNNFKEPKKGIGDRHLNNVARKNPLSTEIATRSTKRTHPNSVNLKRLKKGVEDLFKLRRQTQLINKTFKLYFTVLHAGTFSIGSLYAFTGMMDLRNSERTLMESIPRGLLSVFIAFCGVGQMLTICYNTTALQYAYENLRFSLWSCDWYTENTEFRKLFILAKTILNQPLTMNAYSFYPVNLRTFTSSLKEMLALFLFLYKLTAPKK